MKSPGDVSPATSTTVMSPSPLRNRLAWAAPRLPLWGWMLLGLMVLTLVVTFAAPQSYPGGSSYERSPGGYSQWYDYMAQQGHPIQRWQRPYGQLKGKGQTLIRVADVEVMEGSNPEEDKIIDWVKQGNTLVVLAWDGWVTGAPFRSNLRSPQGSVQIETTRRHKLENFESKDSKLKNSKLENSEDSSESETAELQDQFGAVVWSHAEGKGRVLMATTPWLAANAYIRQGSNFQWLAKLSTRQNGPIWVDEWLHGYRDVVKDAQDPSPEGDLWGYLAQHSVALVLGQGLLILLLLVWGQNQRFGALFLLKERSPNHNEQYIEALSNTLSLYGHTDYVLKLLGQLWRQQLQTRLRLINTEATASESLMEQDRAISQQWSLTTGRPSQELLELLEQTHGQTRLRDKALLDWVRDAEAILRGLP